MGGAPASGTSGPGFKPEYTRRRRGVVPPPQRHCGPVRSYSCHSPGGLVLGRRLGLGPLRPGAGPGRPAQTVTSKFNLTREFKFRVKSPGRAAGPSPGG